MHIMKYLHCNKCMYTCGIRINAKLVKEGSFRINAKLVKEELNDCLLLQQDIEKSFNVELYLGNGF